MSGSLNRVTLIGNLGADPEIRTLTDGGKIASFRDPEGNEVQIVQR